MEKNLRIIFGILLITILVGTVQYFILDHDPLIGYFKSFCIGCLVSV